MCANSFKPQHSHHTGKTFNEIIVDVQLRTNEKAGGHVGVLLQIDEELTVSCWTGPEGKLKQNEGYCK